MPDDGSPPAAPRRAVFDLDGRAAPGLYFGAWALVVGGLAAMFGGIAGAGGAGAAIVFVVGIAIFSLGLVAGTGAQALQRRADGAWSAAPSPVLVFLAAFGLTLVAGFALQAAGVSVEGSPAILLSVAITAAIALGLVWMVVVSPGALSWREMGLRLPTPAEGSALGDVAWGMALAVPTFFGAAVFATILVAILGAAPAPIIPATRDPGGVLVNLIVAAGITPFWEELFFRGFATTAWARTRGVRGAIWRGALFFAFVHVLSVVSGSFDTAIRAAIITFVVRLPVALVLGWVFLRRRTLVAPIALHATYNAIPVLLVAIGGGLAPS